MGRYHQQIIISSNVGPTIQSENMWEITYEYMHSKVKYKYTYTIQLYLEYSCIYTTITGGLYENTSIYNENR